METSMAASANTDSNTWPTVSVIVPALNEEASIGWVIDGIPGWVDEVVLVDGLSIDGTELVVTDRRPDTVIVHQSARGKGPAVRAGLAAASGEIVVIIDGDGSIDPRDIGRYVHALVDGAQFVKGSRNRPGGGSRDGTRLRRIGHLGLLKAVNLLFGVKFTDLSCSYCTFWRRDLERLAVAADSTQMEMELILSAVKADLEITEVPCTEMQRRFSDSNRNAWRDGKRVLRTLTAQRVRRLPARGALLSRGSVIPTLKPTPASDRWLPAGVEYRSWDEYTKATEKLRPVLVALNPNGHQHIPARIGNVDLILNA
jgi:hypothetical protein